MMIEYGVYGDLIIIYPKPYAVYLRGTIGLNRGVYLDLKVSRRKVQEMLKSPKGHYSRYFRGPGAGLWASRVYDLGLSAWIVGFRAWIVGFRGLGVRTQGLYDLVLASQLRPNYWGLGFRNTVVLLFEAFP